MRINYNQLNEGKVEYELIIHVVKNLLHKYSIKMNNPLELVAVDGSGVSF